MAKSHFAPDDIVDGRYKLTQLLGEGSFAEAWLAWEPSMSRKVVLKILKHNITGQELKRRFVAEAQIMATLANSEHPHRSRVVSVITVSAIDADVLYMTLEFVPGGDLQSKLFYEKPSTHAALTLFLMILQGVQVAHERVLEERQAPVFHRDLKPANILLTKKGEPKVTDFGIANAEHSMTETGAHTVEFGTRAGIRAGTLGYAPPEQTNDASSADVRSDIYSLGVILAHLIADFDPGDQGQRLLYEEEVQDRFLGNVATDIRAVIAKAVHAQRARRFQTVREFITAVEVLIGTHPNTGEPPWTPREGRERPAATPTPKTPAPVAQPVASPNVAANPREGHGPLWTEVGNDEVEEELALPVPEPSESPDLTPRKWPKGWIVGAISLIAVCMIGAVVFWPKEEAIEETPKVETVEVPTPEPTPPVTPEPIETKVETPVVPIVPMVEPKVEPKPEAKIEAKAEITPKVEAKPKVVPEKPKVEAPKAETPKPVPVTTPSVKLVKPITTAKVGDTINVVATVELPEGETIALATLQWEGADGTPHTTSLVPNNEKIVGEISVNAGMGTTFKYRVDVRTESARKSPIRTSWTEVIITQ